MAKFVQPNIYFDSSVAFLRNVTFDSSVYIQGVAHISDPFTVTSTTPYALVLESGSGTDLEIKIAQLGTMASETANDYATLTYVDGSLSVRDTRLDNLDSSVIALEDYQDVQDVSILDLYSITDELDASINVVFGWGDHGEAGYATLTYVDGSLASRDTSITYLFDWNIDQDSSIDALFDRPVSDVTKTYVDGSLAERDASITYLFDWNIDQDTSLADVYDLIDEVSTNKLTDIDNLAVAGDASIYTYTEDNIAYLKKLIGGTGIIISEDASTITVAGDIDTGVYKYTGIFDGTADTSILIPSATHNLGTGPFNISVYEHNEQVYTNVEFNGSGDIILSWSSGSLTDASCKYIITG